MHSIIVVKAGIIVFILMLQGCSDDPCNGDAQCEYDACLMTKKWMRENDPNNKYGRDLLCVRPLD